MAINYIEKGVWLHNEIAAQGHRLEQGPNGWESSDDVAVQAIIDSFDPVPSAQDAAKKRINKQCEAFVADIVNAYPEFERMTFVDQEAEARAFLADGSPTVILEKVAIKRGMTVSNLSARVVAKADAYRDLCARLMAEKQKLEDRIDSSADWQAIDKINLDPAEV